MKILVLGNGFDLDHHLPTGYMDFLHFCNYVLDMDNSESPYKEKLSDRQLEYVKTLQQCQEIRETFLAFLKNNRFLAYFNNRIAKQGQNWIDFEREIKGVVNEFKSIELELKASNQYHYHTDTDHKIYQVIRDLGLNFMTVDEWDEITLAAIHRDLCQSLNNFSQALEYYIAIFVNTTPVVGTSPDVVDFDATQVITFNYSNTYERHYGGVRWREPIDHVHGTAIGSLAEEPNIILGITSEDADMHSGYVEFEKYFQRITKRTGNEYKNWLQSFSGNDEQIEVAFFGHSLDSADSDIIKDLILNDKSTVVIYYHNEKAHQQIVANLVDILGKGKLLQLVSGNNPQIRFQKQRRHEDDNTAGVEITRDIRCLYRMHTMSTEQINALLAKIQGKIETSESNYFYSQRKVISLFEVLEQYGISRKPVDHFLAICKALPYEKHNGGKLKIYREEEWYDYLPWNGERPCYDSTVRLINAVNQSNQERFQQDEGTKMYTQVLQLKTSEEVKNFLLEVLSEENSSEIYWRNLSDLVSLLLDNSLFEEAIHLLPDKDMPIPLKAKAKHFKLTLEVFNIVLCNYCRMNVVLDSKVLGGQAEGVIAHGEQNVEVLHTLLAANNIHCREGTGMADMQALCRRIGELDQAEELLAALIAGDSSIGLLLQPLVLPFLFNGCKIVLHYDSPSLTKVAQKQKNRP